jgi:rod shape-determining protein MreD
MSREIARTHWLSVTVFILTGYVLAFAQARVTALRDAMHTQPDFLPGLMVYAGLAFRLEVILACAALLGILFDSLSANPLGTTVASLTVIGLIGGRFREFLLSDQFTTHWVLGLMASGVAPVVGAAVCKLSGGEPLLGWSSSWHWALMTAGGGVITPLWFSLFNRLDESLRYKEVPESVFRADRQIARGRH